MSEDRKEVRSEESSAMDDPMLSLERDHHYIKQLFDRYLSTRDLRVKQQAGPQLCDALSMHSMLEESVFYPAMQEVDQDLVDQCLDEHQEADQLVRQLQGMEPGDPDYDDMVQQLHEAIVAHISEEENQLFPAVRDSGKDLRELALRMQAFESNVVSSLARGSAAQRDDRL